MQIKLFTMPCSESNELNDEMKITSEELIREFKLIGSNGVDYILDKNGELKVIEINPRFQGTYELVENSLGINLLDAHIKACEGEIIEIPNPNQYSFKKIIYARKQVNIGNLNIPNVYDIPYEVLYKPQKGVFLKLWAQLRNTIWEIGYLWRNNIDIAVTRTCTYTTVAAGYRLAKKEMIKKVKMRNYIIPTNIKISMIVPITIKKVVIIIAPVIPMNNFALLSGFRKN